VKIYAETSSATAIESYTEAEIIGNASSRVTYSETEIESYNEVVKSAFSRATSSATLIESYSRTS